MTGALSTTTHGDERKSRRWRLIACVCFGLNWELSEAGWAAPDESELREVQELERGVEQLYAEGKYGEATSPKERACSILGKELGQHSIEFVACINNLAELYYHQEEYGKAEALLKRVLTIREKTLGLAHQDVAETLSNLATLYLAQGVYGKAMPLFERALALHEKALGPEHPHVATSLNGLALLYEYQGAYGKAEPLFERALAIFENAQGPGHPDVAASLNNLARLYQNQGEYTKAEPLFERALDIVEKAMGPGHPAVAQSLNNRAALYHVQGKYVQAKPLLERALAIRRQVLGPEHRDVAESLHNLAGLYQAQAEYGKAEPLLERALAIHEKAQNREHPDIAYPLLSLAVLYQAQGKYEKAKSLLERALALHEESLGAEHPLVALILIHLGSLHVALGKHDSAMERHRRALDIEEKSLSQTLVFAEEHRRLAYAAKLSASIDKVLSSHLQAAPHHHPSAELALTALLRRKGRILDLVTHSITAIRRSLPEEHQDLLDDLSRTRNLYAHLTHRGRGQLSVQDFAQKLAEIQRKQHLLWRELSAQSVVVNALSTPATIVDIQSVLPPDGVLVEIIRYQPIDFRKNSASLPPRYAAYLIFPDRFDWVDLGPANSIELNVDVFRKVLQLKQAIPTDLYDAVMQPIVARFGEDTRRLFIAPDGALNLIPFAALYDGKHYLVERYALHYLAAGRDLLRPWNTTDSTNNDTVVVVANPSGANLPGTEREADLLEDLFPHVRTLLHKEATETAVQRQTRPLVIHLATHGFFGMPERERDFEIQMGEYQRSMSPSFMQFSPGWLDNPMLHSGLVLAPTGTEANPTADGRLTAYEISGWDLRGTELVVLSACGTGLGEHRAGEGVFGLRRAFAMAGAQTQVMSLWDVPDSMTARLMEAYYRKLLEGKGRAEAMQEVQLEMLRSKEHHLPGDWASFVVVGEWSPLSAERLPERPPPIEQSRGCHRSSIASAEQPPSPFLVGLFALLMAPRRSRNAIGNEKKAS